MILAKWLYWFRGRGVAVTWADGLVARLTGASAEHQLVEASAAYDLAVEMAEYQCTDASTAYGLVDGSAEYRLTVEE